MTGRTVLWESKPTDPYQKKTVDTMTDGEIKKKLCKDVKGGCVECPILTHCRYGAEATRRGLI